MQENRLSSYLEAQSLAVGAGNPAYARNFGSDWDQMELLATAMTTINNAPAISDEDDDDEEEDEGEVEQHEKRPKRNGNNDPGPTGGQGDFRGSCIRV